MASRPPDESTPRTIATSLGAIEIVQCHVGEVVVGPTTEAVLPVMVEAHIESPLRVQLRWQDDSGRGARSEVLLEPDRVGQTLRSSIDHDTALQVWGPGTHQLSLVIDLAPGEDPPTRRGPNAPVPCGAITVR